MPLLRRAALALGLTAALAVPSAASASTRDRGFGVWDRPQQRAAVRAGLMDSLSDGRFHGERGLTPAQLRAAMHTLAEQEGVPPVPTPEARITVTRFDRELVVQLGLMDAARGFQAEARRAGLHPPARFGTEVVTRLLGLRYNHPAPHDDRELYPDDTITRAEAAWSLGHIVRFGGWEGDGVRAALATFVLPRYTAAQRRALRVAVSKIGMPYVWGGETDTASGFFGGQVHGGYDCSGFVWRVFKLSGNPAGAAIRGRTAAQMAGEIPRQARIRLSRVRPADLLFFGPARFHSRATERSVIHVGIALGNGWMINSSDQGVFVVPLDGWRSHEFSWARRVV